MVGIRLCVCVQGSETGAAAPGHRKGASRGGHGRAASPAGSGRKRGKESTTGSAGRDEGGESSGVPAAQGETFRGAWLENVGRNRAAATTRAAKLGRPKTGAMTTKNLIQRYGKEEYDFYVAFHVEKHVELARHISKWQRDFKTTRGREPQWDDMPEGIRRLEQTYISIGHKLARLD